MSTKILVSACLLGKPVRYDGKSNLIDNEMFQEWQKQGQIIELCPEVAGGMSIPRIPCEIVSHQPLKILSKHNTDCTQPFLKGAQKAVDLAQKYNIKVAILKESSPSCGSNTIYNGQFNKTKINGQGVTTKALQNIGVKVFNEHQIQLAFEYLQNS